MKETGKRKYDTKIPERKLIGVMVKNKRKSRCIRGHILPSKRMICGKTIRVCIVCRNSRPSQKKNYKRKHRKQQAIKDSKFPLITYLMGVGKCTV